MKSVYIPLKKRAVIEISGVDAYNFLQGIITNDIHKLSSRNAIYACLLTPQGKYLADFFLSELDGKILLDCNAELSESLIKRLNMYKLRSQVVIGDISDKYEVVSLIGSNVFEQGDLNNKLEGSTIIFCKGIAYIDPRTNNMYARSIIEKENKYQSFMAKGFEAGNDNEYKKLRISNTIPEFNKELIPEKSFPLQNRMDILNAIDFEKGCYIGQEVTARSKHRGNIRKSLFTITGEKTLEPDNSIFLNDKIVGKITSVFGEHAIATIEIEVVENNIPLVVNGIPIKIGN